MNNWFSRGKPVGNWLPRSPFFILSRLLLYQGFVHKFRRRPGFKAEGFVLVTIGTMRVELARSEAARVAREIIEQLE
nr:hypothetical protein [Candidatus Sigynarchaeota archaeon]